VIGGTPGENKAVVQGSIAYFGTYSVNEADKVITAQIEGSTFAKLIGGATTQARPRAEDLPKRAPPRASQTNGGSTRSVDTSSTRAGWVARGNNRGPVCGGSTGIEVSASCFVLGNEGGMFGRVLAVNWAQRAPIGAKDAPFVRGSNDRSYWGSLGGVAARRSGLPWEPGRPGASREPGRSGAPDLER
jgi:hypothetical protein